MPRLRDERTEKYKRVRRLIKDGDLAMVRNGGLIARLSDGDYTHVGKCIWIRDALGNPKVLMIAELREGRGGQILTLSSQVARFPGKIDIFRPLCSPDCAALSADYVARMAGHDYGWGAIRLACYKRLTLLRLVTGWKFRTDGTELSPWAEPKHCSQAVCWGERAAARKIDPDWEPTHKNDRDCEPNDLANTEHQKLFQGLTH